MRAFRQLRLTQDDGQDIVEYTLLMAFVVVVTAALFLYNSDSVAAIWTVTNNSLSSAGSMAS
jgi:Flp pilus assembly pilin Flp